MLMRLLLASLVSLLVVATGVAETVTKAAIYTPAAGSTEHRAIIDAMRDAVRQQHGDGVRLEVVTMNVTDNWAWLHTRPVQDGQSAGEEITALMKKTAGGWEVVEMPCGDVTAIESCEDAPPFFEELRSANPQVSPAPLLVE
jgi:ABC-type glycerol-3-phosphate transport system substrate-binding protein